MVGQGEAEARKLLSRELFSVDYILLEATTSLKSFRPRDERSDKGSPRCESPLPHPRHRDGRVHQEEHLAPRPLAGQSRVHGVLYAVEGPDEGRLEILLG